MQQLLPESEGIWGIDQEEETDNLGWGGYEHVLYLNYSGGIYKCVHLPILLLWFELCPH